MNKIHQKKIKYDLIINPKNITLNKKLIMLDKSIIDFVIIHELCHTIYMNHKKDFHLLLKKYIIDEKPYKQALKNYAFLLKLDF